MEQAKRSKGCTVLISGEFIDRLVVIIAARGILHNVGPLKSVKKGLNLHRREWIPCRLQSHFFNVA